MMIHDAEGNNDVHGRRMRITPRRSSSWKSRTFDEFVVERHQYLYHMRVDRSLTSGTRAWFARRARRSRASNALAATRRARARRLGELQSRALKTTTEDRGDGLRPWRDVARVVVAALVTCASASLMTASPGNWARANASEVDAREGNAVQRANGGDNDERARDVDVLNEAWGLVFDNFLPARARESEGFDRDAWARLKDENDSHPPHSREEAYERIRDMLETLGDRYTRFVEPERFTSMLKYDITGVGLNIAEDAVEPDRVKVLGLVLDSSAMRAGVVQDDYIIAVNGEAVRGKSAFAVSSLIQEAEGDDVELTISRAGEDAPRVMSLKRADGFSPPSSPVSMRLEGGHVGYIRLREFNALAERDVAKAVRDLRAQGADAYILDLRDNPGGLVQAGVEIARLFLPADSTIAYTEGRVVAGGVKRDTEVSATKSARHGSSSELPTKLKAIATSKADPVVDVSVPLVVFVNGRSASASEILTGALKDNCRATVVGSQTYGKGLIQSVYELSDLSGMVLTVGKYVTPGLVDIDQHGISVDYAMFPGFDRAKEHVAACRVPPKY